MRVSTLKGTGVTTDTTGQSVVLTLAIATVRLRCSDTPRERARRRPATYSNEHWRIADIVRGSRREKTHARIKGETRLHVHQRVSAGPAYGSTAICVGSDQQRAGASKGTMGAVGEQQFLLDRFLGLRRAGWSAGAAIAALIAVLTACAPKTQETPIKPPRPALGSSEVASAPNDLPESSLDVLVSIPIEQLRATVEASVPTSLGAGDFNESINGGDGNCHGNGVSAGWNVSRGPLSVGFADGALNFGVGIEYDLKGRTKLPLPFGRCGPLFSGSCGRDGEPRRRANLALSARVAVSPDWGLQAEIQTQVTPIDRCQVLFLNIDITDHIMGAAKRALDGQTDKARNALQTVPVRSKAETAWNRLQQPRQVRPGVWLILNPVSADLQPLSQIGSDLVVGIKFRAKPRVVVSSQQPVLQASPLPSITQGPVANLFSVALPVDITFAEASAQLRQAIHADKGGLRVPAVGDQHVVIRDAELFGSGEKLAVRVLRDPLIFSSRIWNFA
jgi:Domain of unknown function (DUF4403)